MSLLASKGGQTRELIYLPLLRDTDSELSSLGAIGDIDLARQ